MPDRGPRPAPAGSAWRPGLGSRHRATGSSCSGCRTSAGREGVAGRGRAASERMRRGWQAHGPASLPAAGSVRSAPGRSPRAPARRWRQTCTSRCTCQSGLRGSSRVGGRGKRGSGRQWVAAGGSLPEVAVRGAPNPPQAKSRQPAPTSSTQHPAAARAHAARSSPPPPPGSARRAGRRRSTGRAPGWGPAARCRWPAPAPPCGPRLRGTTGGGKGGEQAWARGCCVGARRASDGARSPAAAAPAAPAGRTWRVVHERGLAPDVLAGAGMAASQQACSSGSDGGGA